MGLPPSPVFGQDDGGEAKPEQNESSPAGTRPDPKGGSLIPFNWPIRKKWRITLATCFVTFLVGINSTSITAASQLINRRFNISDEGFPHSVWPVTAWNTGAAIAPMLALPVMEEYGMRVGYLLSFGIFVLFVVPQAVATNFATLIVCRFFAGSAGGVLQDVMDGIIADIWPGAEQRSLPVTIYVCALLAGVSIGPTFGGAVVSALHWRWIFYIQLMIYGPSFVFLCFIFRETRPSVILKHAHIDSEPIGPECVPDESQKKSLGAWLYEAVVLPSRLLCTEPVVFIFTLLSALSYGIVFMGTQSVTQVYSALYHFEEYQAGLVQCALVIGELVGFVVCLHQNRIYCRKARLDGGPSQSLDTSVAESRLYWSIPACFIGLSGGIFWYAWSSYRSLSWIMPTIGLGLIGFGVMVVMQAIMMYITDAYEKYAASASAAVCCGENLFAAFLPLSATSMYTNLGFHWAGSVLGFLMLALSFAPVVLVAKGREIRRRSPFIRRAYYE